jgi:predicted O-linked N-acetylglucosamine transferase (SPINDLY family)
VALRPAPVIVNWLGYPGTMGSPYHNYIIADDWIIPESHEIYYSEKVKRLPCYQPNNRDRTLSPVKPSRKDAGLPEDAMVYCCFNGSHKIHRFTFERWMRILAQVPGSVLWLLESSETTHKRLQEHAAQLGIEPERLVFAPKAANPVHLARYPLADLFLDTTPYSAHTTASDALWMGVPVLTCSGRSFASRVCGSLVRAVGTPEMICTGVEEYVERAVAFGNDKSKLQAAKNRLAEVRKDSVLFDMPGLVRNLEHLFKEMWEECRKHKLPQPDIALLPQYLETGIEVNHEEVEVQNIEDYRAWWVERLALRHKTRPLVRDHRFITDRKIFS